MQTANVDFINVESNNRKQQPHVAPKTGPKEVPKVTPTISTTARAVPAALPKEPPKPVVLQATTPKVVATTTPTSKVKQLAKNYDDRVSQIGKQVENEHKTRFNLTQSEFPALPKSSGTVASGQQNPGSRTWSSVVAGDKKNAPTRA